MEKKKKYQREKDANKTGVSKKDGKKKKKRNVMIYLVLVGILKLRIKAVVQIKKQVSLFVGFIIIARELSFKKEDETGSYLAESIKSVTFE